MILTSLKKDFPNFVETFLLNGGLNHMAFLLRLLCSCLLMSICNLFIKKKLMKFVIKVKLYYTRMTVYQCLEGKVVAN